MRQRKQTASKYLRTLQLKACRLSGIPFSRVVTFEAIGGSIDKYVGGFVKQLGPRYANLSQIPVGTLPTWEFNASIRAPDGAQIIVLNWGLIESLVSLTHTAVGGVTGNDASLFGNAAVTCACAIRYGNRMVEWPELPDMPSTRKSIADDLVTSQIEFCVCHELGHSLLGHLQNSSISKSMLSESISTLVNYYFHLQSEEFAADKVAIDLLHQAWGEKKDRYYGSVYRLFRLLNLFEIMFPISKSIGHPLPLASHPPALERWKRIEARWHLGVDSPETQYGLSEFRAMRILFDRVDDGIIKGQKANPNVLRAAQRKS